MNSAGFPTRPREPATPWAVAPLPSLPEHHFSALRWRRGKMRETPPRASLAPLLNCSFPVWGKRQRGQPHARTHTRGLCACPSCPHCTSALHHATAAAITNPPSGGLGPFGDALSAYALTGFPTSFCSLPPLAVPPSRAGPKGMEGLAPQDLGAWKSPKGLPHLPLHRAWSPPRGMRRHRPLPKPWPPEEPNSPMPT